LQKTNKKIVAILLLSSLLLTSSVFIQMAFGQLGVAYITPPVIITNVCENFTVTVIADVETPIEQFDFELYWVPDLMTVDMVQLSPPWITLDLYIGADWIWVWGGVTDPVGPGVIPLAEITLHCDGLGDSDLMFDYIAVMDELKEWWSLPWEGATVWQTTFYWKPTQPDYAPSGVPDFDQRQDNFGKIDPSGAWKWTWCGPTAVANSLWWMDSRFEPGVIPPPTISDGYPLLTAYGEWDDHDPQNVQPFITDLGWYMDTDGNRTGIPWSGTDVHQMEKGIAMYLRELGLETEFVIKKMAKPNFYYIEDEIEKCEDVILLLGIWQSYDGITWWRVGGHYVTCAGVDSQEMLIAFSDPDADSAETVGNGMWLPPGVPHPHPPRPIAPPQEDTVHNDAAFVSHDVYYVMATSPSPGGAFALEFYEPLTNPGFIQNIQGQNCPSEFKSQEGEYSEEAFTAVEVEYSVIISPAEWYFKPPQKDYAPSGVPDFDQKQNGIEFTWKNPYPPIGSWSWCGPTAVANSLWWLDSQFEPNPAPPPEISDGFPLVPSANPSEWDDHDPQNVPYLIDYLGYLMNTDNVWGMQGAEHCGTTPTDMEQGIYSWLQEMQLDWKFYNHTEKAPEFYWIEDEIKRCEDVILLLGFWQNYGTEIEPYWIRNGGHYVTCAGVDSENMMLAISDPYIDNAEWGFPGRVIPPPPHPHEGPPETLHNNATYVSHDFYMVGPSPSPGGKFGLYQYPAEDIIDNFDSCQNLPEEFIEYDDDYAEGLPIYTEIEYAIVISCKGPVVAAGSEDGYVYVHDSIGNLLWKWGTEAYCVSVAFDNEAKYLAGGWRYGDYGCVAFFDANAVTDGSWNTPLWYDYSIAVSESYHYAFGYESSGHESMSVDAKYNTFNDFYVVAAAHDYGLNLYDQWGNLIWQYFDEQGPETIVKISQDGNYIVCADGYSSGTLHYFSHLRDGVPGWGPGDGTPLWSFGSYEWGSTIGVQWIAISGIGDYVAVSGWEMIEIGADTVILLNKTGDMVWQHIGVGGEGSHLTKVDMPCHGRSVVAATEDVFNLFGCDLYYFDDGGDGWDSGDGTPVWTYWPGKEVGGEHNPLHDFYTVSISQNGDVISAGGDDGASNIYVLWKDSTILQIIQDGPAIHSVDLTFTGQYGIAGDNVDTYGFFDKDLGLHWTNAVSGPIRSVAISKIYPCMFPFPDHDLAVTNVTVCYGATIIHGGHTCCINVTVANEGDFTETFNVTTYWNTTHKIESIELTLTSGNTTTLCFSWDTTGLPEYENYTIIAKASIVQDEIDIYDNTFTYGTILIVHVGDVNADEKVRVDDVLAVALRFGTNYGGPPNSNGYFYDPNTDLNCDGKIRVDDVLATALQFGWTKP